MNKRIRELAEQATTKISFRLDPTTYKHIDDPEGDFERVEFDKEKFAELIVRECIEQLVIEGDAWEQFGRNPPQGQENNASAALFAAYRLKEDAVSRLEQHFGVEL